MQKGMGYATSFLTYQLNFSQMHLELKITFIWGGGDLTGLYWLWFLQEFAESS